MQNPYAAPDYVPDEEHERKPVLAFGKFGRALWRWSWICVISAAPSFFWGATLGHTPMHLLAMVAGILCFIVAYAVVECSAVYQKLRANRAMTRSLNLGYGLRLAASIIFPIGIYADMFVGIFAVSLTERVFRTNFMNEKQEGFFAFITFFITTLVQGIMVNILLLSFVGAVYGIQVAWQRWANRPHPEGETAEISGTL